MMNCCPYLLILSTVAAGCAGAPDGAALHTDPTAPPSYLQQTRPGRTPKVFAPGIISKKDRHEFGSTFSANGLEFFYSVDIDGRAETYSMRCEEGKWSAPRKILSHTSFSFNDPVLSPRGDRLYFISDRPLDERSAKKDYDIWFVDRKGPGWSQPRNAGFTINSPKDEYYVSFTKDGDLYFGSNVAAPEARNRDFDLYVARSVDGTLQPRFRLVGDINTPDYEADVFVAPDGAYAIFSATREEGHGQGDLYISFSGRRSTWGPAKNLGTRFNGPGHELCPFVSADGRFFFYTSGGDIYWVDAAVLESYR